MAPDHNGSTCSGVSAGGSATLRNQDARSPGTGPRASEQSPAADQVLDFFARTSCSMALSRLRSATSRLSFWFFSSSYRSLRNTDRPMPRITASIGKMSLRICPSSGTPQQNLQLHWLQSCQKPLILNGNIFRDRVRAKPALFACFMTK